MKDQKTLVFKTEKEFKSYLRNVDTMPIAFNRAVVNSHSNKMQQSIEKIQLQRAINVIKTSAFGKKDQLYVADGQHLRKAILKSKKPLGSHLVVFQNTIEEVNDIIPFISRMNATAKNWNQKNYLDAWSTHGLENYVFLKDKFEKSNHSLSVILEAYISNRRDPVSYKNGKAVINEAKGNSILRAYENACSLGLNKNTSSALATARFLKQPSRNISDFITMISKNSNTFKHKLNRDGYIALFTNLYIKK